jgi:acyl-CoA reductase-like NAD-dependent aldehyde dehydrogenase
MRSYSYDELFIGGRWQPPATGQRNLVISPHSEELIGETPQATQGDVDRAVAAARKAFDDGPWPRLAVSERMEKIEKLAAVYTAQADEMADLITAEMGSPRSFSRLGQALGAVSQMHLNLATAKEFGWVERRQGLFGEVQVRRAPVGVVGAIVPWNVPQSISFLKVAPALAAGCSIVLKPAEETVLDAFLMAEAAAAAGIPDGVVNVVPGGREVGAYLVEHPGVDKVSFTGSTAAGRWIAEACGRLLRPVTLELGGKSAAIVLDDADLPSLIEPFFGATLLNNGQICWLNTRVLAPRSRYTEIVDTITDLVRSLTIGDPLNPETKVGPLVSQRQRERVESYIAKGKSEGARMTTGGSRPAGLDHGWFVEPTIFADLDNNATVSREEIFGPVLSLIPYSDEHEAVAIANDSIYGLGGTVWSSDPERAANVARRVRSGTVGVNQYVNDPVAPFGGIKQSGMGRELGPEGLHAFQVYKTIYMPPAA